MPKLTVIVPVYNTESFLQECIDSILGQDFTDFELILVDDGSSDHSPALCDQAGARDCRVKVIHKENGGVADARNVGLAAAQGDFIGFVDSDDLISPVMYSALLEIALKSQADIVQCEHTRSQEKLSNDLEHSPKNIEILSPIESLKRIYRTGYTNSMSLWSKIYRRTVFDGVRFSPGTAFEDDEMVPKLLYNASKIAFIGQKYYCYRKRENSIITTAKPSDILALSNILEKRMFEFKQIDQELYVLAKSNYFAYLKRKVCEKQFRGTEVQAAAIQKLREYYREIFNESNVYDRFSLFCICYGTKAMRNWTIEHEFEPIQDWIRKIRHIGDGA